MNPRCHFRHRLCRLFRSLCQRDDLAPEILDRRLVHHRSLVCRMGHHLRDRFLLRLPRPRHGHDRRTRRTEDDLCARRYDRDRHHQLALGRDLRSRVFDHRDVGRADRLRERDQRRLDLEARVWLLPSTRQGPHFRVERNGRRRTALLWLHRQHQVHRKLVSWKSLSSSRFRD